MSFTEKRFQVTNEILETEKKYLACLNTLKTVRKHLVQFET